MSSIDLNLPKTTYDTFKHMIKYKVYVFLVLSLSCAFYLITTLQYWITDYMISVLDAEEPYAFKVYCVITSTAPMLGAVLSGQIGKFIGGY